MARKEKLYWSINIVAHPHPPGVYESLFRHAAGRRFRFWGDDFAAITTPRVVDREILQGQILVWTEVDPNAPAIDPVALLEIDIEDDQAEILKHIGFNLKSFVYSFNIKTHKVYVEQENEFGNRLSARRAEKVFGHLFSPYHLPDGSPVVNVTIIPEDDSIARILSVHRLDRVHIVLRRPNPEEFGDEAQRILEELENQGAASQEVILKRAPTAATLELNQRNRSMAEVASTNGYVEAKGKRATGDKFYGSTKEYPKIVRALIDNATSLSVLGARVARENE